jgi:hypothetical protein
MRSSQDDFTRGRKKKCVFYAANGFCKNYLNCQFYHPPPCKFKERCKFKETTCRFFHPKPYNLDQYSFPLLSKTTESCTEPAQKIMSFKDVCEHLENGKMVFSIDENTNYDEIFKKIRNCLDTKTANAFVFATAEE